MLRLDREHTEEEEYFPFSSSYWENRGLRRRLAADLFSILVRYFPLLYPEYSLFPRCLPGLSATCGAPCGRNAALHRRALRMRTELNKPTGNAHAQSGLIFPFVSQCCRPVGAPGTAGPVPRECRGVLDYREDVSGMEFGSDGTANPIQTLAFRFCSKERCCLKGTPRPHIP